MRRCVWLLVAILTSACAPTSIISTPTQPLAITVLPALTLGGQTVRVTWRIDRDAGNRQYCVAFRAEDGVSDWKASCESLDGEAARRFYQWAYDGVPEGRYRLTLTVVRADGTTRMAWTPLCAAGPETTCGPDPLAPGDPLGPDGVGTSPAALPGARGAQAGPSALP